MLVGPFEPQQLKRCAVFGDNNSNQLHLYVVILLAAAAATSSSCTNAEDINQLDLWANAARFNTHVKRGESERVLKG